MVFERHVDKLQKRWEGEEEGRREKARDELGEFVRGVLEEEGGVRWGSFYELYEGRVECKKVMSREGREGVRDLFEEVRDEWNRGRGGGGGGGRKTEEESDEEGECLE